MRGIDFAEKYIGLHEIKNKKELMRLFKSVSNSNLDPSTTPWCALFINTMEILAGNTGTNSDLARSFLKYGVEVKNPTYGDIAILRRNNSTWQGHVGYFVNFDTTKTRIILLSGNQNNSVCYESFPIENVLSYREIRYINNL